MKKKLLIILLLGALLFSPNINFAQVPPNIGLASSFAMFTSVGAFNSVGPTNVTGDIGTHAGAFNGFPIGIVTGQVHVADTVSLQMVTDVQAAYNTLAATPCGIFPGAALGGGQILFPNVYCIGSAVALTGDLILDGQGNPNAVFIFKINGVFSMAALSRIVLVDSASWCNVYWQVNGAFNLSADAIFRGTLISNGAIGLAEGAAVQGRLLASQGAISLNNNMIIIDGSTCFGVPLPIELVSFEADCKDAQVVLTWTTAIENNNSHYSIEKSVNAINWQTIGIQEGIGSTNTLTDYSFIDKNPLNGISYYRLKQTDFDGESTNLNTISIQNCGEELVEMDIYPNPSNGIFHLSQNKDQELDQDHLISVYNELGKLIYTTKNTSTEIDLSSQPDGIYFLHFNMLSKTVIKKLILIR